ncbi:VapC toxin family PIN domain ribonuclease [Limnohabitans sp. 2KL-17]|uniref:type II toxin-antitoxin system VapC family toxin n=1 Tax=Limnohabitans sp. 2KL-17 TaxID=1100704 RepID=UPI000D3D89C7|nr:PIN domain-containing protein [Limnohabitans sp. 2KL-17]PUE51526.1 VapC toxin family PIN domain ribonuclease [Limnohabitans sp. 2KL-17]
MILVDSSVWIDFFRVGQSTQSQTLARCLGDSSVEVGMADLVLFEVMRGFREGGLMREAQTLMSVLPQVEIGGTAPVLKAAERYRQLRSQGRTAHSPIDVLLASYCMTHRIALLHRDADFESLQTLGGLDTWPH